jgi:hypothetical protein
MGNMPVLDLIAIRIARRHVAAVLRNVPAPPMRIEYTNGGRITDSELTKTLEPIVGQLITLAFRPSLTGLPTAISWEAVHVNMTVMTGRVLLHAAVRETEIVRWAEVTVEHRDAHAPGRLAVQYRRDPTGLIRVEHEAEGNGGPDPHDDEILF